MIQITAGTFGYYNGRKVIPLTEADGPLELGPDLEARLVKEGVAQYIGGTAASKKKAAKVTRTPDKEQDGSEEAPPQLDAAEPV